MNKKLQKDAIDSAQALINLCENMEHCNGCPFFYSDNGGCNEHCTIGCPADSWDIEKASIKVEEKEQKEKPKKKIVPYDFFLKEDRDAIIGKCLIRKHSGNLDDEFMVVGFSENCACFPRSIITGVDSVLCSYGTGKELFEQFSFQNGEPVGKEVEGDGD